MLFDECNLEGVGYRPQEYLVSDIPLDLNVSI